MEKIKLLTLLSVGLLLLNIVLVGFILFSKPHQRTLGNKNRNLIISRLGLDQNQIKSYDSLIQWHRTELSKNERQMLFQKRNLYQLLKTDKFSNQKDSLISDIGKTQVSIEHIHLKHFEGIKLLCTENQSAAFDTLMSQIADMFVNHSGKPHQLR